MKKEHHQHTNNYLGFLWMLVASFIAMYLLMFSGIAKWSHFYFNLNTLYMTLLMVSSMAVIMLFFMRKMYTDKKLNTIIIVLSIIIFIVSAIFLRTQYGIDDREYLRAMISHHSMAILSSLESQISDPETQDLANKILETQNREIAQMEAMLERLR